ncbi:PucR family transcriptional regulator [Sciscionella marina]|uniref:PucR family transcriptional regulator n=1 Tax=Sciscionella marina TaxID=508770 RepID=UPI0012F6974E|nr:helix-turn-helix domain-containing protein [Sciscionella marina]
MPETVGGKEASERRSMVLDKLHARRHELAERLVAEYRAVIDEYRELPEPVLDRDVTEAAVQNIEHAVRTLAAGHSAPDDTRELLRRSAARRVHQHVSLPSLLRSFRLWGVGLWRSMDEFCGTDELGRAVSIELADAMMVHVDHVSTAVTQAYVRESATIAADSLALRTDVLETLLTGEAVSEHARRQNAVLRMTLRERLLVVVVQLPSGADPLIGAQAALRAVRNRIAPVSKTFLVGARESEVVCICGLEAEEDGKRIEAECDRLLEADRDWAIGVGCPADGHAGVRRSYSEARAAADLGCPGGRAMRFADVLLDQILRSVGNADALLGETVRPLLEYDRRKRSDLLPTLRAYVSSGFSLTKAAAELSVNPNTVVYRLRRIHALTRRDPMATDDLLLLSLGIRLFDSTTQV